MEEIPSKLLRKLSFNFHPPKIPLMDERFSSHGRLRRPKEGIFAIFGLKNSMLRKIYRTSPKHEMNITIGFFMKRYSGKKKVFPPTTTSPLPPSPHL
jgi:hypothetical protein